MSLLKTLFLFAFLALASSSAAQLTPPGFDCVKGDTLIWTLPPNVCGPFEAIEIYFATDRTGPYALLAEVTDPAELEYIHTGAGPGSRYYYLRSRYACMVTHSAPTDTLDNQPPGAIGINFVSVESGGVRISWQPSGSPQTRAYIIYRATQQGTVPIDTVYNVLEYLDTGAQTSDRVEFYYVLAMDACGTIGAFGLNHNTILLGITADSCTQEATLTWNGYNNWENGVEGYDVFVTVNNGPPQVTASLDRDAIGFTYPGLRDEETYCFWIRARETGSPAISLSNRICFTADIVEPVRELCLRSVSVAADNRVIIDWEINERAELSEYQVLKGNRADAIQTILAGQSMPATLNRNNSLTDGSGQAASGPVYYRVTTRDLCGETVASHAAATIHLTGQVQPGRRNVLNWTPFYMEAATVLRYRIYRVDNGQEILLDVVDPSVLSYTETLSGPSTGNTRFCYLVIAEAAAECQGTPFVTSSRSNIHCVEQNSLIYTPNAIVPNGENNVFKPVILYRESLQSYELLVFDRWGALIFSSTDPDLGWDGSYKGRLLPPGSYTYRIRATQSSGRQLDERGTVYLID